MTEKPPPEYDFTEQKPISAWSLTVGPGGISVNGPREFVPPQIKPGSGCLRESCANNVDRVCQADPEVGTRGALAPFRMLCPEAG